MATRIIVKIGKDGNIETTVHGVKGTGCTALVDALTAQLGDTTADSETPEFYETSQSQLEYTEA